MRIFGRMLKVQPFDVLITPCQKEGTKKKPADHDRQVHLRVHRLMGDSLPEGDKHTNRSTDARSARPALPSPEDRLEPASKIQKLFHASTVPQVDSTAIFVPNFSRLPARGRSFSLDILFYRT